MKISIEFESYKKKSNLVTVLETFLDYHLMPNFYGEAVSMIDIQLIETPKPNKKLLRRILYGYIAQISLKQELRYDADVTPSNVEEAFDFLIRSLAHLDEVEIKRGTFEKVKFMADINALRSLLPQTEADLDKWKRKSDIYREINQKIFVQRNNDDEYDKRHLSKNVSLREFGMGFEGLPFYATNAQLEQSKIEKRRKKALAVFIQQEFLTRYIRSEIRKKKFTGQYESLSIILSDRYEVRKLGHGLQIFIPFDKEQYKGVYPPFEINMPVKTIISSQNESKVNHYLADLLIHALRHAKDKNLNVPADEIIEIIQDFKDDDCKFEWYHCRRMFKDLGVGARLHCKLRNHSFALDFVLVQKKTEIFRKEIHLSQPWHEAWRSFYDDIIFADGKLTVSSLYARESIFSITTGEIEALVRANL